MASPREPEFVVRAEDRTLGGALTGRDLARIGEVLRWDGFVLLPSDTAYALAGRPRTRQLPVDLNKVLDRDPAWPFSLAFPSVDVARLWVLTTAAGERLFEKFCPGPITVVCDARLDGSGRLNEALVRDVVGALDRTLGVRIPDSVVERDVAALDLIPTMTPAVRDPLTSGFDAVTSFERAYDLVATGMGRVTRPWCAVEGRTFYAHHSTVVRVPPSGREVRLLREGHIPYADIRDSVADLPVAVTERRLS